MPGREVILRRTGHGVPCDCECRSPGGPRHESCHGWIDAHMVVVELVDEHGHVSRRCPGCGELGHTSRVGVRAAKGE